MRATLTLPAIALLAIAVSGCERPLPPEERGQIVVPPGPQPTGAAAPLVAPTHPYETSQNTATQQVQSGYFSAADAPLVPPENTNAASPAHVVPRHEMRQVLYSTNPAVYSNPVFTREPNMYQDPVAYQAWLQSLTTASGTSTPPQAGQQQTIERNIYFDWDKYALTPEGRQIVDQVARQARSDSANQIALVGKADLSGTDHYNLALSQRRANTVREALVADGIAADRIETRWVGDREPPVPTARGVREPRNRVVEVTMNALVGSTAAMAPQAVVLPRRVLFTTVENQMPGSTGQAPPGSVANGSMPGAFGSE